MQKKNNDPRFKSNHNLNLDSTIALSTNAVQPTAGGEHKTTDLAGSSREFDMVDMLIAVKRDAITGQMTAKVLKSRW